MSNYFFISWKESKEPIASAFSPKGVKKDHELIKEIDKLDKLPFDLHLVKITLVNGSIKVDNDLSNIKNIWYDYQPNNLGIPIMSDRLKNIIESNLKDSMLLEWVSVLIKGNLEKKLYFIPRFKKKLDVLDENKTLYIQGTSQVIKPVFSIQKLNELSFFTIPANNNFWKITTNLYIDEKIKKAVIKEKITGINFEKIVVN